MNSVNDALAEFSIRAQAEHHIGVGRYVIMRDHLHLFVCGPDDFRLGQWIGMLKQHLAKVIEWTEHRGQYGNAAFSIIWPRSAESYGQKWNYVRENPARAGLVEKAEDGPYAGEIIIIDRV